MPLSLLASSPARWTKPERLERIAIRAEGEAVHARVDMPGTEPQRT